MWRRTLHSPRGTKVNCGIAAWVPGDASMGLCRKMTRFTGTPPVIAGRANSTVSSVAEFNPKISGPHLAHLLRP